MGAGRNICKFHVNLYIITGICSFIVFFNLEYIHTNMQLIK